MIAAILFPVAILAVVALYGLHVWREVRMAQTKARADLSGILRATIPDSQAQRITDVEDRVTRMERSITHVDVLPPPPQPSAEVFDLSQHMRGKPPEDHPPQGAA